MIRHWAGYLCLALLIFVQIHNHFLFPWTRGFDAAGHVEYIDYLKTNHHLPKPWEGWELYQAPLYYLISSFFSTPNEIQFVNFFVWVGIIWITWKIGKSFNSQNNVWIIALIGSLPINMCLSHTISNEPLAGLLIGISLWIFITSTLSTKKQLVVLGIISGLALCTKATAWILIVSICVAGVMTKSWSRKKLAIYLVSSILVGGWFYLRSWAYSGNPFVASTDYPQYAYSQPPGYRDLGFFINMSAFWKGDLFKAHWYSFIPGTYFSWFWDSHNVIIPVQPKSTIGLILVLISVPLVYIGGLGYFIAWKTSKYKIIVIYGLLLFGAYIIYNLKYPFYSTVKAAFLYSLIIPSIMWLYLGLSKLPERVMKIVPWYCYIYVMAVCYAFYIRPWWY